MQQLMAGCNQCGASLWMIRKMCSHQSFVTTGSISIGMTCNEHTHTHTLLLLTHDTHDVAAWYDTTVQHNITVHMPSISLYAVCGITQLYQLGMLNIHAGQSHDGLDP